MTNIQFKFDKMVEMIDYAGLKVRVISELDYMEKFFHMEIVSANNKYGGWLNQFVFIGSKNLNDCFYFFPIVSINGENFTVSESKLIMSFWDDALNLCGNLNKLKIPFVKEFEGENGRIQYLKNGYKKINKRLSVQHI